MKKVSHFLIKLEEILSGVLIVSVVLLVFGAALLRTFDHPVPWSVSMAQLLFVWLIYFGANQAFRNGKHIGVDAITKRLPQKVERGIEIFMYLLILGFLAVVLVTGFQFSISHSNRLVNNLPISFSYATMAVPFGCFIMMITVLNKLINMVIHFKDRDINGSSDDIPSENVQL